MRFLIILLLVAATVQAQNTRFIYRYSYISDSTKPADTKSTLLALDVTRDNSIFFSYEKYRADSLTHAVIKKQNAVGSTEVLVPNNYIGDIHYLIEEFGNPKKVYITDQLGSDNFRVFDARKIKWKILSEKQMIGKYPAQKAEAQMYGRKWTAWFATEIPIQDGPYKFHGLPNLIVKIEDQTGTHTFALEAVQKTVDPISKEIFLMGEAAEINYAQFVKLFREFRNDPAKSL